MNYWSLEGISILGADTGIIVEGRIPADYQLWVIQRLCPLHPSDGGRSIQD